jgi:hypothetical protein
MLGDALLNWFFLIIGILVLVATFFSLVRNLLISRLGGYAFAFTAFLLAFGRIWTARTMPHDVVWFISTLAAAVWSAAGALALAAMFRLRNRKTDQNPSS